MIYTIRPSEDGFLNIDLEFLPSRTGTWEILLPTWRPGRYQSQHFAKNIPSLHAYSRPFQMETDQQLKLDRITSCYMTKYERARILGTRALQIRSVDT